MREIRSKLQANLNTLRTSNEEITSILDRYYGAHGYNETLHLLEFFNTHDLKLIVPLFLKNERYEVSKAIQEVLSKRQE